MADFCHQCTFELFGEELAPFNDFVDPSVEDDEMITVLCEGCGYIDVDSKGRRLHWDEDAKSNIINEKCPHGLDWSLCRVVSRIKTPHVVAFVSDLNFHGVGEFIAQYPEGDASSETVRDYIPTCNTWLEIERLLTP